MLLFPSSFSGVCSTSSKLVAIIVCLMCVQYVNVSLLLAMAAALD